MTSRPAFAHVSVITVLSMVLCGQTGESRAQAPPASNSTPAGAEQEMRFAERDRWGQEAARLRAKGKLTEAIAAAEKMLAIERELLAELRSAGRPNAARRMELDLVGSLRLLGELYEQRELLKEKPDFRPAEAVRKEAVERLMDLYPPDHPWHYRAREARIALERIRFLARLSLESRRRLREADQLDRRLHRLWRGGKPAQALPLAARAVAIRKEVLGQEHPDYAISLNNLAVLYWQMGDYARAAPLLEQALEIQKKVRGEKNPAYATSLSNLGELYRQMGDYARAEPLFREAIEVQEAIFGKEHPNYARSLNHLAGLYRDMGDYARAEPLYREALEIQKKVFGDQNLAYATSLNNLGALYWQMGDYERAEPLYRQALEIRKKVLGEEHLAYAISLNNLASLYQDMGEYTRAEQFLHQSLRIQKKLLGEGHPNYATGLNNLGALYRRMGDYARAEPLLRQALEIRKELLGERHPDYAVSLSNLGLLYYAMGDYARAEPLLQQAVKIRKKVLGERHPAYAISLTNLGLLYAQVGDHAQAEQLYRQALEIHEQLFGKDHPSYAVGINNLASIYQKVGDYARAESLFRQALEIEKKVLGEDHPLCAASLDNLARLYQSLGDFTRSEPAYLQAIQIARKTLGEEHPHYARYLRGLGLLYAATGRAQEGEKLLREALTISEKLRSNVFRVQGERQRLSWALATRFHLDHWLTVAGIAGVTAGTMHSAILRWKGVVLQRQREDHIAVRQPELKPLVEELNSVRSRWATLALAVPGPAKHAVWERQLQELAERKEDLESELARKSVAFRQDRRLGELTSQELANQLPPRTVFVDFFLHSHFEPKPVKGKPRRELRLVAFVLRRGQEPSRLELGPVEPLEEAIATWRRGFGTGADGRKAADELRRRVLQPLRPYLADADTLLVAPDGPLCRFPLAALPGREPGSYLIEELAVGYVSSGRHLAELLALRAGEKQIAPHASGLLLAGGIEYDAPSEEEPAPEDPLLAAARAGTRGPVGLEERLRSGFGFLPGTLVEAERVAAEFASILPNEPKLLLTGAQANERRMKQELARGWRYVHLATHGFFAPPEKLSAWRAGADTEGDAFSPTSRQVGRLYSPLLLSGLVLAGVKGGGAGEDGVLTAEEVAALDLEGTDLVVLSACDTGLGAVAAGEGVLGLQRAFHVAGARTVVSSLWRVNDAATSLLMEEFYRNLWQGRMGPLEALRQAQLFVLRRPERVRQRGQELAVRLAERGLKLDSRKLPPSPERSHPGLWAGFFMSGKWWGDGGHGNVPGDWKSDTEPQH